MMVELVIPSSGVIDAGTVHTIMGETPAVQRDESPTTDPYLATGEPKISEAATLLAKLLASGAVARLDLLHDALTVAHRRGRAAEHAAVERIAHEHAGAFVAAVVARADDARRRDARPWCER